MGILNNLFNKFEDARIPVCPYCQYSLPKIPGRKTKCPNCGKYMYVRTTPKHRRLIVTEQKAHEIDDEWAELGNDPADEFGELESVSETRKSLSQQFGKNPSKSDVLWRRYQLRLKQLMKENDLPGLAQTYYEMAIFLKNEGKPYEHNRKIGYELKIKIADASLKDIGSSSVQILTAPDSCHYCQEQDGQILSIHDAKKERPIPVRECTGEYGCRCVYLPVVER